MHLIKYLSKIYLKITLVNMTWTLVIVTKIVTSYVNESVSKSYFLCELLFCLISIPYNKLLCKMNWLKILFIGRSIFKKLYTCVADIRMQVVSFYFILDEHERNSTANFTIASV